jgi:hypothetical protein
MQLARCILEIKYKELPDLFAYKKKVLKALEIDMHENTPTLTENINIEVKDQSAHIAVEAQRIHITIETSTSKQAQKFLCVVFKQINDLLHLNHAVQIGFRCFYIQKSDESMKDLVSIYKSSIFADTKLIQDAVDVGLSLTFKDGGYRVNFHSGPMEKDQLKMMLEHPPAAIKTAHFLDLDFVKGDVDVNDDTVRQYLEDVFSKHSNYIKEFENEVIYE